MLPDSDMTPYGGAAFPTAEELAAWLPQYEIHSCLFMGVHSAVYVARQPALERHVMIRVMPEPSPELAQLLVDRLRSRARLVNPKIVGVFDFGRTLAGPLYLVTEYVDGTTLDHLVREKLVTPKHAYQLAIQICDTLQLVHEQRVIHGALDVHTTLVTHDWQVKLTGIGMCEMEGGELSWLGDSTATFDDDIQALGRVIHEMFCGHPPSASGEVSRSLPPGFARVIARCIDPEPSRRFEQPHEVRLALTEALKSEKPGTGGAAKPAATLAPAPATQRPGVKPAGPPVSAPPRAYPGQPPRIVYEPPPPRSWYLRMDDFLAATLRVSLHLVIFGGTLAIIAAFFLLKDKVVFENPDEVEDAPAMEKGAAAEPASPPTKPRTASKPATAPRQKPRSPPDSVAALNAQYREAVQQAAAALEGTRRNDMPFLQRELQRLQSGLAIPATDEPDLPPSLKKLRSNYRAERARLGE